MIKKEVQYTKFPNNSFILPFIGINYKKQTLIKTNNLYIIRSRTCPRSTGMPLWIGKVHLGILDLDQVFAVLRVEKVYSEVTSLMGRVTNTLTSNCRMMSISQFFSTFRKVWRISGDFNTKDKVNITNHQITTFRCIFIPWWHSWVH